MRLEKNQTKSQMIVDDIKDIHNVYLHVSICFFIRAKQKCTGDYTHTCTLQYVWVITPRSTCTCTCISTFCDFVLFCL